MNPLKAVLLMPAPGSMYDCKIVTPDPSSMMGRVESSFDMTARSLRKAAGTHMGVNSVPVTPDPLQAQTLSDCADKLDVIAAKNALPPVPLQ